MNDLPSVVSARARQHRHLAARFLYANLDDAGSLFFRERRALACRAARDEKVNALLDLTPRQPANAIFVKRERLREWRDDRGTDAGKWCAHMPSALCPLPSALCPVSVRAVRAQVHLES